MNGVTRGTRTRTKTPSATTSSNSFLLTTVTKSGRQRHESSRRLPLQLKRNSEDKPLIHDHLCSGEVRWWYHSVSHADTMQWALCWQPTLCDCEGGEKRQILNKGRSNERRTFCWMKRRLRQVQGPIRATLRGLRKCTAEKKHVTWSKPVIVKLFLVEDPQIDTYQPTDSHLKRYSRDLHKRRF